MSADSPRESQSGSRRPLLGPWALFLAGPVVWYLHFWVVYLVAEAACATGGTGLEVGGAPLLSVFVVVVTVLAMVVIWWLALRARRVGGEFTRVGLLLGLLFAFAVMLVGLPALFLAPC